MSSWTDSRGAGSERDESRIRQAVLAVRKDIAIQVRDLPSGGNQHRLSCGRVPFHRGSAARIEMGFTAGHEAELEGRADSPIGGDIASRKDSALCVLPTVRPAAHDDQALVAGDRNGNRPAPQRILDEGSHTGDSGVEPLHRGRKHDAEHGQRVFDQRSIDSELAVAARELTGDFLEVFVDTPLEVAEARDPKGLYRKARRAELANFTGIDSPYERPENAELTLDGARLSAEESAARVIEEMRSRGLLGEPR